MRFDLKKLDERIRNLQALRQMASDPEMAAYAIEALSGHYKTRAPQFTRQAGRKCGSGSSQ